MSRTGVQSSFLAAPLALFRRFADRQHRRHTAAELARLAATGDHLLRDIGLDPRVARDPAAMLEYLLRRR